MIMDSNTLEFDLVMITTCIDDKFISSMISSVVSNNSSVKTLILCLNQANVHVAGVVNSLFTTVEIIPVSKSSLSHVRNLGLKYLKDFEVSFKHIMFPDDDSTFSNIFFEKYHKHVVKEESYLINVLNLNSSSAYKKILLKPNQVLSEKHYRYAMSVNMIVANKTIDRIVGFDENLGVGTPNGSSEDSDFFIRANEIKPFSYCDELFNFHPKNIDKFKRMETNEIYEKLKSYSRGNITFLRKHNRIRDFYVLLGRTILTILYYLMTFNRKMVTIYSKILFFRLQLLFVGKLN